MLGYRWKSVFLDQFDPQFAEDREQGQGCRRDLWHGSHADEWGEALRSSGYAWWRQDRAHGPPGSLTCKKRVGQLRSGDAAMTSALPGPAWKGFRARHQVASSGIRWHRFSMFRAFVHWRCYPAGRWRARPQGVGRTSEAARCTQNGWVGPLGLPGRWGWCPQATGRHGHFPRAGRSLSTFGGSDVAGPGTQGDG